MSQKEDVMCSSCKERRIQITSKEPKYHYFIQDSGAGTYRRTF
jgi:hypothetical protein